MKFSNIVNLAFENSGDGKGRKKVSTNDLNRELQPKLDLLQERTDEVINKIVKERIRKLREDV